MSVGHAIKAINPTRVIIVFDGKNGSARRRSIYPDYKAKRKVKIRLNRAETVDKQDNQLQQLIRLTDYLSIMPLTTIVVDGSEADDVIAYLASDYFSQKGSQVFIMSSDKDFMQLVNDKIHIWSPTKKKMFYTEDVVEEYGILPANFALYRSLIGDDSDNIPGVNGVGSKTVIERFPKLATDSMTLDDFVVYAKDLAANNKPKIYQKVVGSEADLRLYYEVIQLSESNINMSNKMKILDMVEDSIPQLAKMKFHTMLAEDRMSSAIKNIEMWLRETTAKLNQYALED